jgi:LptD protein
LKTKLLLTILALVNLVSTLQAQEIPLRDSLQEVVLDSLLDISRSDSLLLGKNNSPIQPSRVGINLDSILQNQNRPQPTVDFSSASSNSVKYSKDSLDQEVESFARDSMKYDIANKQIHLWGDASVIYGDIKLEADYIVYNWTDNIVTAEFTQDSLGRKKGLPKFTDKDQNFTANKLRFNFKTKKGTVLEAVSTFNGMYVRGGKVKIFDQGADSLYQQQRIYSKDAIFTTCDHPEPHFGIRSRKQVLIPDKVVVVGPSNIEVGGVPTPIWLPFGFFPLNVGESTGLIFPRNYGFVENFGYGLEEIGWYFPINDYMNAQLTGDFYTRGSFRTRLSSNYNKKYKFNGSVALSFSSLKVERGIEQVRDNSFSIRLSHNQDAKAHPSQTFGGSINIQTNNFQSRNNADAASKLNNSLSSNFRYQKSFPGKPFSLNASMSHSQNTNTREVEVQLPVVNFTMQRIYPFKSKNPLADEKWYDKIGLNYRGDAQNRFTATDTTLFSKETFQDARYGVKHGVNMDASFQLFKYFTVSPRVNYTEVWNFKYLEKTFDPTLTIDTTLVDSLELIYEYDTVQYGQVVDMTKVGFKPLRKFDAGITMSTKLFGTLLFKRGPLRGLRHTATPNIGLSFAPDYSNERWGYYQSVQRATNSEEELEYSIFDESVYRESLTKGQQFNVNYGLDNIFEGKFYSKRDSTDKRFKIFDSVRLNGSYNIAADSFGWSPINMTGRLTIIPQFSTLALTGRFDPYNVEGGKRVNKLIWNEDKKLARFDQAQATINTGFTIKQMAEQFSNNKKKNSGEKPRPRPNTKAPSGIGNESLLDLLDNFRVSHNVVFSLRSIYSGGVQKDTFLISTNSIQITGELQLTEKMALRLGNISYDFKAKRMVYPDLTLTRDLHCWEMGVGWTPRAFVTGAFTFFLRVKPGALDFIKVPYGRNQINAGSRFN